MTGAFPGGEQQETVVTADGVRLRATHLPAPDRALGVVLAPGFSCSWDKAFVRRVARWLAAYAGVLVVDLRGQGGSGGLSTLGELEVLDVDAAVAEMRRLGYREVVTLGFSMGAVAVIRHAGLLGERTANAADAVVAVSAASRWWRVETPRMRWLSWTATTRAGRLLAARTMGTRIDPTGTYGTGPSPEQVVGAIAPTPLLLVHGGRDGYLLPGNAEDLYAAAGEPTELWVWPEYGHAELALDADQAARIGAALAPLVARARMGA